MKQTRREKGIVKYLHVIDYGANWKLLQYVITPPDGPDFREEVETQNSNYPKRGEGIDIVSTSFSWKIDNL